MINWADQKAPKGGTMILAVFNNYPTPLMAMWSGAQQQWCVAVPQVEPYQGEWNDCYFETEYFDDKDLKVWAEIKQ
jgi:hypothetical protein